MKTISILSNFATSFRNSKFSLTFIFVLFLMLSATAQTFPTSCTSKDLSLVSARLVGGDACNSCAQGSTQTRTLVLGINNKTGSTRTAFAFWATLTITHQNGTTTSTSINRCSGPIPPTGPLPAFYEGASFGTITYQCGDSLMLTGLHLAWTDASPNSTCASINPATINPKCGTLPSIQINVGVNGTTSVTDTSCTANGSIAVSPFGGTAPYNVSLDGVPHPNIPSGGTTNFTNVAAGSHAILITDASNCVITLTKVVNSPPPLAVPLSTQTQTSCLLVSGTCTITSPVSNVTYALKQGGTTIYTAVNGSFSSVAPGTYALVASSGTCTTSGDNVVIDPQPPTPDAPAVCVVQPSLCGPATGSVTILSPTAASNQYSINNGQTWQSSNVFNNVAAGSVTGIKVKTSAGCISEAATCSVSNCTTNKVAEVKPEINEMIADQMIVEELIEEQSAESLLMEKNVHADFILSPVPFKNQLTVKYNFDYQTPVKITVYNSQGRFVVEKNDFNDTSGKMATIDFNMQIEKGQLYIVKVTTNRGSNVKSILSEQ